MGYCTPDDVRQRAVGLESAVIPDVSSISLNLTTCIAEADAEIDEAARAGDYETPFEPVPERICHLSALGALARARRALCAGNQVEVESNTYWEQFAAGLALLRTGDLDLGTLVVGDEGVVLAEDETVWTLLDHAGLVFGSVSVRNEMGSFTYVEDRGDYEPGYQSSSVKDYVVDHRRGRIRWLVGGRLSPGQAVLVDYEYFLRQPHRAQDAEYAERTASEDVVMRMDHR